MKTGILGGTFNPPHFGHLYAAKAAYDELQLDKVLFIPTNIPPHKALPEHSASVSERLEMLHLLLEENPWAEVSRIELERGGASYTVDTLRELHKNGETDLYLIIGTDMFLSFDKIWKAPEEIVKLSSLVVCAREKDDLDLLKAQKRKLKESMNAGIYLLHKEVFEISSTEIRDGAKRRNYTAEKVAEYIEQNHLYGV